MQLPDSLSLYIHIPFCRSRCGYCDFNTYAGLENLIDEYVEALVKEIVRTSVNIPQTCFIHTIFFGGGTPSLLSSHQFEKIINSICGNYAVSLNEISTEANPTCLSLPYLKGLKKAGINRLSLGVQSASQSDLTILGRRHSFEDVRESVADARKAGFENINLDLIFGIPEQSMASFKETLENAIQLSPEHLSLYALTIEAGTPLAMQIDRELIPRPDEDLAADMYLYAMDRLEEAGFDQYEISNWSCGENKRCLHNLQYWHNFNYLGFGAGAHSHYGNVRWENEKTIPEYINSVEKILANNGILSPAGIFPNYLETKDEISETMMVGLRLTNEGICEDNFKKQFGLSLTEVYPNEIMELINQKVLEWVLIDNRMHLRLTKEGRLLGNQVFLQFILDD